LAKAGLPASFAVLAGIAGLAASGAAWLCPAGDPDVVPHVHRDLAGNHLHLAGAEPGGDGFRHAHAFVIDRHHPVWPRA